MSFLRSPVLAWEMDPRPLRGKVAIVTGASRGIGKATAVEMARRGARAITITYRTNIEAARLAVAEIKALGCDCIAIKTPRIDSNTMDSVVDQTMRAFTTHGIDILVNNAGHAPLHSMGTITPEVFNDIFHLNVLAPLLYVQSVLPIIRRGGSIINLGSIGARTTLGGDVAIYCSSKAALEHLTRNLAVTHSASRGITINNVAPGATDTDAVNRLPDELVNIVKNEWTALRRLGTPEEIADCVCFLAGGGGARWINGATIAACGGASM